MKKVFEKKVIAIIVTYNRKKLLKECINAVLNQNYKNCIPLIIDNSSTDNTYEYIKEYIDSNKIIYKNTGSNLGGAGGFNYGMKEAYKIGCDYMWIMDDDCIPNDNCLNELFKADKKLNGDYGFLSSKVLWKDNSICVMNRQKKTFSKWLKDFDTNYQKIAMCSFVSFFVKSEIVKKYGLPIKEFFIWTDDWEYSRRISRNEDCYFISSSVVVHKCNDNFGANIASVESDRLDRFKYLYRNDCVLYRREGIKGYFLLKVRIMLHKFRVLKSNKTDKEKRLSIINDALKTGKTFYPSIEYLDGDNYEKN